ncbi:FecR family protein [Stakelama marina]|uniref:FecR domain-containing protein n=1 Tax=Stakelama marina TaxID=2826939 RepID=A0A8T4IHE4_9SPHN|nr:FecR domain-containing protein [Stakelama marina]MBR0551719.1 FecR domain-containing protein [Stakelama marina]
MVSEDHLLAAARWHVRSPSDDMDWDGFTNWLEADARHREAFDAVALDDAALADCRAGVAAALEGGSVDIARSSNDEVTANDDWPATGANSLRWWRWAGGAGAAAIAAGIAAMIMVPGEQPASPPAKQYLASDGARRIVLPDGARVALASGSSLSVAAGDATTLTLKGAAYFDVPHRTDRTLTVRAGDFRIVDLGTRFEVTSTANSLRVTVAEGNVSVRSPRLTKPMRLSAGQGMLALDRENVIEPLKVAPANVGSFRRGQLVYDNVPLAVVAAELGQYTDGRIVLEPGVGQRRFSGSLALGGRGEAVANLARLMDLQLRREGDVVRLSAGGGD